MAKGTLFEYHYLNKKGFVFWWLALFYSLQWEGTYLVGHLVQRLALWQNIRTETLRFLRLLLFFSHLLHHVENGVGSHHANTGFLLAHGWFVALRNSWSHNSLYNKQKLRQLGYIWLWPLMYLVAPDSVRFGLFRKLSGEFITDTSSEWLESPWETINLFHMWRTLGGSCWAE